MSVKRADKSILSRRYAKALFELAKEGNLSKIEKELDGINNIFTSSKELNSAISSPIVSKQSLNQVTDKLLKKVKVTGLTKKFCDVLAENRRLYLLPNITESFKELLAESKGEVVAEVTSATTLKKAEIKNINESLEKVTKKKVKITQVVNDNIIGGLVIKVGSKMLDNSLKSKLERMQLYLKQEAV